MKSPLLFLCLLLSALLSVKVQAQQDQKDYRSYPYWVNMMDDSTANFFEVQKAFELFWEGKQLPEEEDEIIGEKRKLKNNLINKIFNAKELEEQKQRDAFAFDYKRYRRWLIKTEPYVRDDGSILFPSERLELWKSHYKELNEQK